MARHFMQHSTLERAGRTGPASISIWSSQPFWYTRLAISQRYIGLKRFRKRRSIKQMQSPWGPSNDVHCHIINIKHKMFISFYDFGNRSLYVTFTNLLDLLCIAKDGIITLAKSSPHTFCQKEIWNRHFWLWWQSIYKNTHLYTHIIYVCNV